MPMFRQFSLLLLCLLPTLAVLAAPGRVVAHQLWSSNALYLTAHVDDPLVVGTQVDPLGQPWLDDAIAVYLDLNPRGSTTLDGNCVRVVISAAGGATVQRGDRGGWRNDASWFDAGTPAGTIRYMQRVNGEINDPKNGSKGYDVEIGLNWALLRMRAPFTLRKTDPMPTVGFALAVYAQGEMEGVTCWPTALTPVDQQDPTKWGKLQFQQDALGQQTVEPVATAPFSPLDIVIDGVSRGQEWLMSGAIVFPLLEGTKPKTTITNSRQAVTLVTAWYSLDPLGEHPGHQPVEPWGPWAGPDTPLYHLQQIKALRETGIDALAVVIPADPKRRIVVLPRLLALVDGLADYEIPFLTHGFTDAPLLMPVIDLAGAGPLDLTTPTGQQVIEAAIDDFYRALPARYRAMMPDARRQLVYPVALTTPDTGATANAATLAQLTARLQARWGAPFGVMVDEPWPSAADGPEVLARRAWNPQAGLQVGNGPVQVTMLAPGVETAERELLPRADGALFAANWQKVILIRPDVLFLRSWNDFAQGTEITASRQCGKHFQRYTKEKILEMAMEREVGLRLLAHSLPPTIRAGVPCPVEVLLKQGGTKELPANQNFRLRYRLLRVGDGRRMPEQVLEGIAVAKFDIDALAVGRYSFELPTTLKRNRALDPGEYEICLDVVKATLGSVDFTLFNKKFATLTIPLTITRDAAPPQAVECDVPTSVLVGEQAPIRVRVRNRSGESWRKGAVSLRLRWLSPQDVVLGERLLSCPETVEPGKIADFGGTFAPAPAVNRSRVSLAIVTGANVQPVQEVETRIVLNDLRAQFTRLAVPLEVSGLKPTVDVPVTVRNVGVSSWEAGTAWVKGQWLTWDGRVITGATGYARLLQEVLPGDSVQVTAALRVPAGRGMFRLAFALGVGEEYAALTSSPGLTETPVLSVAPRGWQVMPLDLSPHHTPKDWAAEADNAPLRADLDLEGNSLPIEEFLPDYTLPALGYLPGYPQANATAASVPFQFGRATNSRAPMLRGRAQEILLPAETGKALYLIATNTAMEAQPVTFVVRYTDGAISRVPLTIPNWLDDPTAGDTLMLQTRHIHTPKGDNWDLRGSLFVYQLPLDPTRTLKSLTFPAAPEICVFALTLERAIGE